MSPPASTQALARRVAALAFDDLPRHVVEHAKACLLDWIGSAVCGSASPTAAITLRAVRRISGQGAATLVGRTPGASAFAAALYNGAVAAVDEIDDVHQDASLHPGIVVVPAALAAAEECHASGRRLLTALVAGYDVATRVARAAGLSHYAHWHTTGTCGTFGAAAAAGSVLGLGPSAMTMALGLAGTQAAGLWESLNGEATMAKHLHGGKAASSGVLAAFLARDGFRGSSSILEGDRGFLAAASTAGPDELKGLTAHFGRPYLITRNFFKRYACCRAAFEGIQAVAALRERGLAPAGAIRRITVTMRPHRLWLVSVRKPTTISDAKFSQAFCMALMAVHGRVSPREFTPEALRDPAIRRFMRRVVLAPDPTCAAKARIAIEFEDGSAPEYVEPVCRPPDVAAVRHKFVETAAPRLTRSRVERLLTAVDRLDRSGSLAELGRLLAAPSTRRLHR
jgi:2-methylcitrate dehydratase PrpD